MEGFITYNGVRYLKSHITYEEVRKRNLGLTLKEYNKIIGKEEPKKKVAKKKDDLGKESEHKKKYTKND
jgi:hypothetical protein